MGQKPSFLQSGLFSAKGNRIAILFWKCPRGRIKTALSEAKLISKQSRSDGKTQVLSLLFSLRKGTLALRWEVTSGPPSPSLGCWRLVLSRALSGLGCEHSRWSRHPGNQKIRKHLGASLPLSWKGHSADRSRDRKGLIASPRGDCHLPLPLARCAMHTGSFKVLGRSPIIIFSTSHGLDNKL